MYAKIFESIYDGTLVEDWRALITFEQMLVLSSPDGIFDMTPTALARRTGIPIEHIEAGIQFLEQPDPASRTPDAQGRRIVRLDDHRQWGWIIVNHQKYKDFRTAADRRDYMRDYMRERRSKSLEPQEAAKSGKDSSNPSKPKVAPVNSRKQPLAPLADTDTDTDTTTDKTNSSGAQPPEQGAGAPASLASVAQARRPAEAEAAERVFLHWQTAMGRPRAVLTPERRRKILAALKAYPEADLLRAIDGCAKTPHNMGDNDRGERYDDISLILRDAAHIERFQVNFHNPPRSRRRARGVADGNLDAVSSFVRMKRDKKGSEDKE